MGDADINQMRSYKSGYVAIVGKPNVGKSTILNGFIGQKIAAVSIKPQTTRKRQLGIFTREDAQIIFVDTPGLHSGDYKLSDFINEEARYALMDSDLILFVADSSQFPDKEDRKLAEEIDRVARDVKRLLVLNKIDITEIGKVQKHAQAYQEMLTFTDTITISALTAAGREELLTKIIALLPEGPQYFSEEQITSTYEREIVEDLIRASALFHLRDEVPYSIFVHVNEYAMREENVRYVHATLFVERESQKGIVVGKGGTMIKKIGISARKEIEEMSGESVYLDLTVKVEKNWRNNPDFLRRFGLSHDS